MDHRSSPTVSLVIGLVIAGALVILLAIPTGSVPMVGVGFLLFLIAVLVVQGPELVKTVVDAAQGSASAENSSSPFVVEEIPVEESQAWEIPRPGDAASITLTYVRQQLIKTPSGPVEVYRYVLTGRGPSLALEFEVAVDRTMTVTVEYEESHQTLETCAVAGWLAAAAPRRRWERITDIAANVAAGYHFPWLPPAVYDSVSCCATGTPPTCAPAG